MTKGDTETQSSDSPTSENINEITGRCLSKDSITKPKEIDKSELLLQYIMMVDNQNLHKTNKIKLKLCSKCLIEKTLIHADGICVCLQCGESEHVIVDSDKPNYKESVADTKPAYPYKRQNHLNWLRCGYLYVLIHLLKQIKN
jgi:hypothetical protein